MISRLLRELWLATVIVSAAMAEAWAQAPSQAPFQAASRAPSIVARADGRLDISVPPAGAVMRYTLDGTDPTRDAGEWLAPVRVPPGYTLKARAIDADGTPVTDVA